MSIVLRKFWAIQMLAWDDRPAMADIRVISAIFEYHNDHGGGAWPSIDTLKRVCKLSRRTVQGSLNKLQDRGLVSITRGNGRQRTNLYRIEMDALPTRSPVSEARKQVSQENRRQRAAQLRGQKDALDCAVSAPKECSVLRPDGAADCTQTHSIYLKDSSAVNCTLSKATSIEPYRVPSSAGKKCRETLPTSVSPYDPWLKQLIGIEKRIDAGDLDAAALDRWRLQALATAHGPNRHEVVRDRAKALLKRLEALTHS